MQFPLSKTVATKYRYSMTINCENNFIDKFDQNHRDTEAVWDPVNRPLQQILYSAGGTNFTEQRVYHKSNTNFSNVCSSFKLRSIM